MRVTAAEMNRTALIPGLVKGLLAGCALALGPWTRMPWWDDSMRQQTGRGMTRGGRSKLFTGVIVGLAATWLGTTQAGARAAVPKQRSLDEWRSLTSPTNPAPRVFVKGDNIRFYFQSESGVVGFSARWGRLRVPTEGYKINSAILSLDTGLAKMPAEKHGWREATVIAGAEWHRLTTNLVAALAPTAPAHGIYYRGFLSDRLLYRDGQGTPRFTTLDEKPKDVVIDRHFSIDETLELLARLVEEQLAQSHPGESLFLLLAPNTRPFPQPLLLDRRQRRCVWLAPAALYDPTERGLSLATGAQGFSALLFESHGLALIKNPVSSAFRLVDLAVQTAIRFLRLPLPRSRTYAPVSTDGPGMDLSQWEAWLDHYTGTRRQEGSLQLLLDGERFFPRLRQAIAAATNHIHLDVYIFDKDDVAVEFADQLKQRSSQVEVSVILDRMSSIAAGASPPATPLPEDFVPPASIYSYLEQDSRVRVRPFLNPWFSSDHSKVYLIDGTHAWLGGMNLGREYRYEWHDLMVELTGPVVTTLENEFRRNWAHAGPWGDLGYAATAVSKSKPATAPSPPDHWMQVRLLPTQTGWKPFSTAVQGSFRKAEKYIYIENPYLFDKRVLAGLVWARKRGVEVRVILPRVNDFKAGGRVNLITANYLLEHGVRVYFYPGMTHVKALLVDDWACLGSANLNHLSLRLCQEHNIATSDPAFAARLKRDLFEEDFARSFELTEPISVDWVDFMANLVLESF